jgi:hypothetical protein
MNTRAVAALAAVAGFGVGASAQIISTPRVTTTLSLNWMKDSTSRHDATRDLEFDERALIMMNISFTGQNTPVNSSPNVGAFSSGADLGLSPAYLDIRSTLGDSSGLYNGGISVPPATFVGPNTAGASGYGVRSGWRPGGNVASGSPASPGFQNIGPGQLPSDPSSVIATNPITGAERLSWAPNSFTERFQTLTVSGAVGTNDNVVGLYVDLDGTVGGAAYLPTSAISVRQRADAGWSSGSR